MELFITLWTQTLSLNGLPHDDAIDANNSSAQSYITYVGDIYAKFVSFEYPKCGTAGS
jgi:hypothetical protein